MFPISTNREIFFVWGLTGNSFCRRWRFHKRQTAGYPSIAGQATKMHKKETSFHYNGGTKSLCNNKNFSELNHSSL